MLHAQAFVVTMLVVTFIISLALVVDHKRVSGRYCPYTIFNLLVQLTLLVFCIYKSDWSSK